MKLKQFAVPLVCSAILAGCGGGGDSSGTNEKPASPPGPTLSLGSATLSLEEDSQDVVAISYKGDARISVSGDFIEATLGESDLTIAASEVDRPKTVEITVTVARGDRELAESISVYVSNTSAEPLTAKAESLLGDKGNLIELADDRQIYRFFVDFAYLGGVISHHEKALLQSRFTATQAATYIPLEHQMLALSNTNDLYLRGRVPDSELKNELQKTETMLIEHSAYGKALLADITQFSEVIAPGFTPADMAFDRESGLYSRFLSNEEFGAYVDGEYRFTEPFSGLSNLVRRTPNDPALCEGA